MGVLALALGGRAMLADPSRNLLLIPEDVGQPFWQSVHDGAERAAAEYTKGGSAVHVDFRGPVQSADLPGQISQLEAASAPRYDGIMIAPLDRGELVRPVERAIGRGLPVVVVETGLDLRDWTEVVGDHNFEAGRVAAECLANALGAKGNVILFRHHVNAADTEQREQGFLQVISEEYPGIHLLVTDFHAGPTAAIASRVVRSLLERFHDQLDGIFTSSECAGKEVLAELVRQNLGRRVKFVGIEDEGNVLRPALATGLVNGLVVLDPETVGYEAVRHLMARIDHRPDLAPERSSLQLLTPADPAGSRPLAGASLDPLAVVQAGKGLLIVPSAQLVMVGVPGGSFVMGSAPNERRFRDTDSTSVRVVLSKPFWLGKFEVTQRQWTRIMAGNPSSFVGESNPVDNVSWNDAAGFCRRITDMERASGHLPVGYAYCLPTEAQWEYACRAGDTSARAGKIDDLGWYAGNSGGWVDPAGPGGASSVPKWQMTTHPVGQKQPNAWGFYDMYGNVLEWCQDTYAPYAPVEVTDPRPDSASGNRVLRGGGWWTDGDVCFAFSRSHAPAARHHNALGLRLALAPLP